MSKPSRHIVRKIKPVHEDERGAILDILLEGEHVRHTGIIKSKAGTRRGNHYHKTGLEYMYVLKGKLLWVSKDATDESAPVEEIMLETGDLLVNPPMTAHALIFREDTDLIEMSTIPRAGGEYERDTVFFKLIDK